MSLCVYVGFKEINLTYTSEDSYVSLHYSFLFFQLLQENDCLVFMHIIFWFGSFTFHINYVSLQLQIMHYFAENLNFMKMILYHIHPFVSCLFY